jgi:hypothetical protein
MSYSQRRYSWGAVKDPLREALQAITGEVPPEDLCPPGAFYYEDIPDELVNDLQDWCSLHANPPWATGLWVLEAAENCVKDAIGNANIPDKEGLKDART